MVIGCRPDSVDIWLISSSAVIVMRMLGIQREVTYVRQVEKYVNFLRNLLYLVIALAFNAFASNLLER